MNYSEIKRMFNFELPSYTEPLFDDFLKTYDESAPALSEENAKLVAEKTELPEDGAKALVECVKKVNADEKARLCAKFLIYVTVYARLPWQNRIYTDDLFTVEGLKPEQVCWVIAAASLANTLINKKPPEELNAENVNAFRGYSRACFEKNGYWGILEWSWNMLCAGGCMFVFGILKFVPGEFGSDFRVITDGKRYVSLANGEYYVDKNGALIKDEARAVCKTCVYEDENVIKAHVISARGIVSEKVSEFSKAVWKDFLRKGTPTLDIHIPAKVEYTPAKIKEACMLALDFYKSFYKGFEPAAIAGYSWIFAPQLEKVLPEDGNILSVNRSIHIMPCIGTYDAECRFLRAGSGLQKRIADECAAGTEFHYAVMYAPLSEIETFGAETE